MTKLWCEERGGVSGMMVLGYSEGTGSPRAKI